MKAYKVLTKHDGRLLSFNVSCGLHNTSVDDYLRWEGGRVLEYKKGEITRPKIQNSKLFVFADKDIAKIYSGLGEREVWLVEVDELLDCVTVEFNTGFGSPDKCDFNKVWKDGSLRPHCPMPSPLGTKLCGTIKLIKKI